MSLTQRASKKRSNVSVNTKKQITVARDVCISKREFKKFDYSAVISGFLSATVKLRSEIQSTVICVWRVFSHYKLPLWAESQADPRKIRANMLTDQWRQRVTHNLQQASNVQQLQTHGLHLRADKIHIACCKTKLQNRMSQICRVEWEITSYQGGYKYQLYTQIRPLKSFHFIHYWWFPFPHSPPSTITWYIQSWECKHVISLCFSASKMWHFTQEVSAVTWTVSKELQCSHGVEHYP